MIPLKTQREIEVMHEGGKRLRRVLEKVAAAVKPGVSKVQLDKIAEKETKSLGGKPSFKMVPGYHSATCLTVNDEVVHGIPDEQRLEAGDIIGIDIGLYFRGFHTDLAETIPVQGRNERQKEEFLAVGRRVLEAAIEKAKPGNYVGDLSLTIQKGIKEGGFATVKTLTGHGVGRRLHEEPAIPMFLTGKVEKTPQLKPGMTLAIEVIYNQGTGKVVLEEDGWTIRTLDGKISGLFEETVAVTDDGPLVLTR